MIDQFVIVRGHDSGVHCGYLQSVNGRAVLLKECRIIWHWYGKKEDFGHALYTLKEVALYGSHMTKETCISEAVAMDLILDACDCIVCTKEAEDNLRVSRWLR